MVQTLHAKQIHPLEFHIQGGSEFVLVLHIFLPKKRKVARPHVQQMAHPVTLERYCSRNYLMSDLSICCPLSSKLQIQDAATNVATCRSIIDTMGYSANSHFGGSQAFAGGGCAHQTRNNWYQVMNPDGNGTSCDAAPPAGSAWQRVCACSP